MKKICVFCGRTPEDKNKEHIIPQWLIKMTGSPNRKFYLGTAWLSESRLRNYSANQFQFPACRECNDKYSDLEKKVSNIVSNILDRSKVITQEIDLLCDWFDKVRVGLWLGYRYLEQDYFGIDPHFYIDSRVGRADRVLYIYCLSDGLKGLSFGGVTSPIFFHMPSCFYLRIKNLLFVNLSTDYLISRRVGFPYPEKIISTDEDSLHVEMNKPLERVIKPILKCSFRESEYAFFQPIIPFVKIKNRRMIKIENAYVKNHILSVETGKGKIIFRDNGDYLWLSGKDEIEINCNHPSMSVEKSFEIMKTISIQIHEYQLKLFEQGGAFSREVFNADDEIKRKMRHKIREIKTMQNLIVNYIKEINPKEMFYNQEEFKKSFSVRSKMSTEKV